MTPDSEIVTIDGVNSAAGKDLSENFLPQNLQEFAQYWQLNDQQIQQFSVYSEMIETRQKTLNLISNNTLPIIWTRHFHDSAQIWPIMKELAAETANTAMASDAPWLLDLGSGAGFPGLVLGILSGKSVHLVEANHHKADFLRQLVAATNLTNVTIHGCKIAALPNLTPQFVSARALAPLTELIKLASGLIIKNRTFGDSIKKSSQILPIAKTIYLFPKGSSWRLEIENAKKDWKFTYNTVTSKTESESAIIIIKEFHRVKR